ncbi:MAG: type II secretion system F family protein [Phycisphaeraceae bacterium]|nr:type II secretion system F family protein [Phycisphaeraceae bacterium]
MNAFEYTAIDGSGRRHHGSIMAPDIRSAASVLQGRKLAPIRIEPGREGRGLVKVQSSALRAGLPIRTHDRVLLLRQWSLMLRSGMTLLQSIDATIANAEKKRIREALTDVRERVSAGSTFSEALSHHPRLMPEIMVNLIASAEPTGIIDRILSRGADHLERTMTLRRNLITSLTYPAIVVLVSIAVVIFLVVGVIPKISKFLVARDVALPGSTQFLLDLSAFVTTYGLWILLAVAAALAATVWTYMRPKGRLWMDRAILSVPLIGKLFSDASLALMTRTLGMLLESGQTLIYSIRITAASVRNRALAKRLGQAEQAVLDGSTLSTGVSNPLMPALIHQLIDVGEKTGDLPAVLRELADHYESQLDYRIRKMVGLVEPALILIVGGIVGFVYYAFFSAMIGLSTGR